MIGDDIGSVSVYMIVGCVGDYVYVVLVAKECVCSADMSFVMGYSGLKAVVSGTVCVGIVVQYG